ncbi:MAG: ABC-F family ATP-binding cassette domain-containing protein [Pseudomonadota bacterium]
MAQPPILTLSGIRLGFGGRPLFDDVALSLGPGDRLAVVGRNGSGKSTLMKVMAGLVEPDEGTRFVQPGLRVAYLPQDPDLSAFATLGAYAAEGLDVSEAWRAEAAMEGLEVAAVRDPGDASGGERRRAALARLIAGEPDLMLLDEPTNHLDIRAIQWLEQYLAETRTGFALISHDRAFLTRLTTGTLWLDRGEVRRAPVGFAGFEPWREKLWAEEDAARHKLERLIAEEARWAVEGISARRTRNQGRLRRLQALRAERASQVARKGAAAMTLEATERESGKRVIEARGIEKRFGAHIILRPFDLRISRGDCLAVVGPNGAGKTTLIRLLTGEMAPDAGTLRHGTNLEIAIFDQARAALDPGKSLWATLTGADEAGGADDRIDVRGRAVHPVGYLKDYLFDERQARGPVSALSGGEKARLLMARLMMRPANLLVLDEPTNDLDVETLDLLQELIGEFEGTVILVSHDRDFIDRVATVTVAMEGDGHATVYAGGWSDYRAQVAGAGGRSFADAQPSPPEPPRRKAPGRDKQTARADKLSFKEEHRLASLPAQIERLEAEIAKLAELLGDPDLYEREPVKFRKASEMLEDRQARLAAAEEEWLALEEKREALA